MKCKDFIFKATTDQLDRLGYLAKMDAFVHQLICKYCRTFVRNDRELLKALEKHKEKLIDDL